jgi:hypothetical protein
VSAASHAVQAQGPRAHDADRHFSISALVLGEVTGPPCQFANLPQHIYFSWHSLWRPDGLQVAQQLLKFSSYFSYPVGFFCHLERPLVCQSLRDGHSTAVCCLRPIVYAGDSPLLCALRRPPGCKDANHVLRDHGPAKLSELILNAQPMWTDEVARMGDVPDTGPEERYRLGIPELDHQIDRPGRIQHSWMSRNTLGEESMVTVTFQKRGESTLMSLLHSGLPNDDMAKAHEKGWNSILDKFSSIFVSGSHRRK